MRLSALAGFLLLILIALPAPLRAQEQVWLQIEAQPDLPSARDRAAHYAALFADVRGFLAGDWYTIVLGPMDRDAAELRLLTLTTQGLIPADSFLADGSRYGPAFFGEEGALTAPAATAAAPEPQDEVTEADLTQEERKAVQAALAWFGHYDGAIDGAFGRGTRAALAAWQEAQGHPPTGVLLDTERLALLAAEAEERAFYGFEEVREEAAGITARLPLGLVAHQGYEPPFVQFAPRAAGGPRLMLISEQGEAASLAGLFDLLTSMALAPGATGQEAGLVLEPDSFSIDIAGPSLGLRAWARLHRGQIKGFALLWTPDKAEALSRMAQVIRASFSAVGDKVLDPGLVPLDEAVRLGLISGLAPRAPAFSRSGFYVSDAGAALTLAQDLGTCTAISIDGGVPVRLAATDPGSGAGLLIPAQDLAPDGFARLSGASARLGAEVMLAGYSYGDRLPAPVLTHGLLEAADGESGALRLRLAALDGDRGGPILNRQGEVIGMLGAARDTTGRSLPEGVAIAAGAGGLAGFLRANGITPVPPDSPEAEPERLALDMTLRVDCWN